MARHQTRIGTGKCSPLKPIWPAILLEINKAPQEGLRYLSLLAARLVHNRVRQHAMSTIDLAEHLVHDRFDALDIVSMRKTSTIQHAAYYRPDDSGNGGAKSRSIRVLFGHTPSSRI